MKRKNSDGNSRALIDKRDVCIFSFFTNYKQSKSKFPTVETGLKVQYRLHNEIRTIENKAIFF